MSVYRITRNIDDYMMFAIDDSDVYDKMEDFDIDGFGKPLEFEWRAPRSLFLPADNGSEVKPDITQWNDTDLVLSPKAKGALASILENLGELYELDGDGSDYSFFNPTARLGNEIIDLENSQSSYFDDGIWKQMEKLVFKSSAAGNLPPLFTIDYDGGASLYCSGKFLNAVKSASLNGLNFNIIEER